MNNNIVIIQNKPTQFDTPLYNKILLNRNISLTVFYTSLFYKSNYNFDPEISIKTNFNIDSSNSYKNKTNNNIFYILKTIINLKPKLVIVCGWFPFKHLILSLALKLFRIKIGIRSDNTIENSNTYNIKWYGKRIFMPFILLLYDTWHPVGKLAHNYLLYFSFFIKPTFFFTYSIDVDWFHNMSINYKNNLLTLQRKYNIHENDFVIIGVLKWNEREDPITLVKAVLSLTKKYNNIKLILLGDGPLSNDLNLLFNSSPMTFITPGYVAYSELPLFYSLSKIFVHSAKSEPFGVSVQEALSCGLPVITSNKVGSRYDFINSENIGNVYPFGDEKALKDLLIFWYNKLPITNNEIYFNEANKLSYDYTISEFNRILNYYN
jgi:glycosyltransferase involved in cell wall biosynthesis